MSVIDVESLLSEITDESPCGEDLEYDPQFAEMEKLAQGTPERQYGNTIIPAEPPDWRGVSESALNLLARTRDVRVAAHLTRALLNTEGLPGFADGLALLEGLLERHWALVHPQLDPDDDHDPTLRINTIVALCDPETTLHDLRNAPLVSSRALGRFSLRDIQIAAGLLTPVATGKEEPASPSQSMIDGAFQDAHLEDVQATAQAVAAACDRMAHIEALLTDQVGVTQSPDLSALTGVLKEIRQVLNEQLQRRGVSGVGAVEDAGAVESLEPGAVGSGSGGAVPRMVVGEIANREDVIRTLDKICEYYSRYEPSSPVPFLLKRTRRLVRMDFMEILRDLTPGGTDQADLIFGTPPEAID